MSEQVEFDPAPIVQMTIPDLTAALGELTEEQLKAVWDAEMNGEARAGAIKAIKAEGEARDEQAAREGALPEAMAFEVPRDQGCIVLIDDDGGKWHAIACHDNDWEIRNRKFVYKPGYLLDRDHMAMAVSRVAFFGPAPEPNGPLPLEAEFKLAVPLIGGGGRRAEFPPSTIAFDIPADFEAMPEE